MSLCALCGQPTLGAEGICLFHFFRAADDDWATANRLMCDFLHRGIVPPALSEPPDGFEALLEVLDEAVIA